MTRKQSKKFTDVDDSLLSELGVDSKIEKAKKYSAVEERIIAGFEEIQRFVTEQERLPIHGEQNDIFERLYAVRLDTLQNSEEYVALLKEFDVSGILTRSDAVREENPEYETDSDEELLGALGVEPSKDNDLTQLKHVRSRAEIKVAEEIARRHPCEDFDKFRPVFDQIQNELDSGFRVTERYQNEGPIGLGDLFIVEGNKVLVADSGEEFKDSHKQIDRRLRVIYDNGTESNLLLRSLQKALWRDPVGRRMMDVGHDAYPLFTAAGIEDSPIFVDELEADDETSGYLYILRSDSEHPFVSEHRDLLHKIGFTRGDLEDRFNGAEKEPTFLMAGVEVLASYRIANASAGKLENVLHRFFASARIDINLREEVGGFVEPREWFLVPFPVIKEAINLIKSGEIQNRRYDVGSAQIIEVAER